MRKLLLSLLATMCVLVTATASFAQSYASDESKAIKDALDRFQSVFGTAPEGVALAAMCNSLGDAVLRTEYNEKAKDVARLYRNAVTLLKDQPAHIEALPNVYSGHYKRGRVSDMSVTDQIGMASFQYTYISFLMWYIKCFPLPSVSRVPLEQPLK